MDYSVVNFKSKINIYNGDKYTDLMLQFSELGNALSSFSYNAGDLNKTTIDNAGLAMDMLLRLAIGLKDIPIDDIYPSKYERLLGGDIWCMINFEYYFDKIQSNRLVS